MCKLYKKTKTNLENNIPGVPQRSFLTTALEEILLQL